MKYYYFLIFYCQHFIAIPFSMITCFVNGHKYQFGEIYAKTDNDCEICTCLRSSLDFCKFYSKCEELNCLKENIYELKCCRKLNCKSILNIIRK